MKKFLVISVLAMTSCIFASCDWLGDGGEPITPQSPKVVRAAAMPAVVEYNGTTTIEFEAVYAETVWVNGTKMSTVKGSYELKNLTLSTNVEVVAYGKSLSDSKTVSVQVGSATIPKVIISAPTEAIPYGTATSFKVSIEGITTSVTVDGVAFTGDTFNTPILFTNKDYAVVVTGPGGTVTQKVTILVSPAPAPIVTISAPKDETPYGMATLFKVSIEGVFTSVTVDGVALTGDIFYTPTLFESKDYVVSVTGPGGVVTKTVSIKVADWKLSQTGLATFKKWKLQKKISLNLKEEYLGESTMTKTEELILSISGRYSYLRGGEEIGNGPWSFGNSTFEFGGNSCKIKTLDKDKFDYLQPTPDGDGYTEYIWIHE